MKKGQKPLSNLKEKTVKKPKTLDKHTAKFIAVLVENLPRINADVMEGWIQNPKALQKILFESLCPPKTKKKEIIFLGNNYLKLLSKKNLILDACDDGYVIETADNTFTIVDSDFKNYDANEKSVKTEETEVGVYELQKDSIFADFFNSVSTNLDSMCFTHSQIKQFVKKYRNWLRTEGCATFFLFKSKGKFFVASVLIYPGGDVEVRVFRFGCDVVCHARNRHRVFLPALAV